MTRPLAPVVHAACLAAQWAHELGLPHGTYWEPAIARGLLRDFTTLGDWTAVEANARAQLGLPPSAGLLATKDPRRDTD